MRTLRPLVSIAALALLVLGFPTWEVRAGMWPSEVDWVERGLESADIAERRAAAVELARLPRSSAGRLVLVAMRDDDIEVRVSAAEAALRFRLDVPSGVAVAWLAERDSRLRLLAVRLLERARSTRETLHALSRALGDPDLQVEVRAARALGATRDPGAVLSLLGHIDEANLEMQLAVVDALRELRDPKAVVPLLGKVQDGRAQVREAVARALSVFRGERVAAALVLLLRDPDDSVRLAAVTSLGRIDAPDAIDALVHVLNSDSSLGVRVAAVRSLSRTGTQRAARTLIGLLDDARSEVVIEARLALATMGEAGVAPLVSCLSGQPTKARADACVYALGRSANPDASLAIGDAFRRRVASADAVLEALGELRDRSSLPIVLESLSDSDPWVRWRAMTALEAMLRPDEPDGRAVEPLLAATRNAEASSEELLTLVSLLGRTGSPRVAPDLERYATAQSLRLRISALRSLGWVRATSKQDLLLAALDDPHPRVRREAALALRRAGDEQAVRPLLARLDRASERDAVWLSLGLSGPLAQAKDEAVLRELSQRIALASGPVRDGLLEAVSRVEAPQGGRALALFAERHGARTRAKVAELLAAHPEQRGALRTLASEAGATRANAVWSLGFVGDDRDLPLLAERMADRDSMVAANAAVSFGRLAAGITPFDEGPLCALLEHHAAAVRTSTLVGLRLAGRRCSGSERTLLGEDPSVFVRIAAAQLLVASSESEDEGALGRCLDEERDARVAAACERPQGGRSPRAEPVTVFVHGTGGGQPVAHAAFALRFSDGSIRHGMTDRRGAVCESFAPAGQLELEVPMLDDTTLP